VTLPKRAAVWLVLLVNTLLLLVPPIASNVLLVNINLQLVNPNALLVLLVHT
jgi:hypothetical protein